MLASHVLRASWYSMSMERHTTCLKTECGNESSPLQCNLYCFDCGTSNDVGRHKWENNKVVFSKCDAKSDISEVGGVAT
ncbi:cyclic nucleotide-gated channel 14 [Hibiscus trionum]|uniref:Cyclic nucleotide-gated channel 14 n=1 Tax=Hibiscus trionum TaxID=183268 RepID=A0A9W7I2J9_HIBTR|nr:cyclic nucleotide-gated channel 14 [Hibiscus trionum]